MLDFIKCWDFYANIPVDSGTKTSRKKKLSFVNIYTGVGTRITQLPIKTFSFSFSSSLYDWTAALRSLYTDPVLNISPVLLEKEAFKCRRASLSYNPAEALLLPLADFHRPPHPTPLPPHSLSISFPLSLSAAMAEQQ